MTYEVLKNGKDTVHLHKFNDIADFTKECEEKGVERYSSTDKFYGGMSASSAIDLCTHGILEGIKDSQKIIDDIQDNSIETVKPQWLNSIAGAFPNVPAFLAGENECMFNLGCDVSETAPIKVIIGLTSSRGVDERDLRKRGAAILALVMKLAEVGPVEAWAYIELDRDSREANLIMVRINTAPINLSVANYMLSHAAFTRGLGYHYLYKHHRTNGKWAFNSHNSEDRLNRLKFAMGVTDNDIVIGSAFINDEIIKNPIKYINQTLAKVAEHTQH